MNQSEFRDLLLSIAAEASVSYDKALFERNSKFNEVALLSKKLDELKEQSKDSIFSPRSNLSSYDTRLSLEQELEKGKLELAKLDSICDSCLNRKEELLEGVELLDSILEEREEYLSGKSANEKTSDDETNVSDSESDSDSKTENDNPSINQPENYESDNIEPTTEELKKVISYLAHQCGEISNHTILDPYRARNELRGICVKWSE